MRGDRLAFSMGIIALTALAIVLLCLWAAWRFTRTPLGHAVVLMRENDERAAFLGYNVFATKAVAFTLATTLAAVAGALFAAFQRLISPAALDLAIGTEVVFMAVLGGTGAFLGPFLGATVYLLFQPAEEIAQGARAMIADGALLNPKPDHAVGLHLWNELPLGEVSVTEGSMMAGADLFTITIRGSSGHAAMPDQTRDVLVAGRGSGDPRTAHRPASRGIPPCRS